MQPRAIIIYCGFLLSVTAFSVDISLPAFRLISTDLQADYFHVQLIVPVFVLATGIGQIFAGPWSDRVGRKPVLLAGLTAYGAGALLCNLATGIEVVLMGRIVQGFGAAAGVVIGRAIIRDLYSGQQLATNMALATMIFAFGPIVAPLLGVTIMEFGSWRLIFFVIAGFAAALLLVCYFLLPETNMQISREATRAKVLAANFKTVLANPQSRFFVLLIGPSMGLMMTILISIPRIYDNVFGITGVMFAVLFALHGIGIIIGQLANRRLIVSIGTYNTLRLGAVVLVFSTLMMSILNYLGVINAYVLSAILILFATGYLVVIANITSLAMDPHGNIAGFVSSLLGLFSQFIGSLIGIAAAWIIGGDLTSFALILSGMAVGVYAVIQVGHGRISH